MVSKNRFRLQLEQLEDRLVPAFNAMFDPTSSTWTLSQATDNGAVTVHVDAGNNLSWTDGAGTSTVGLAGANLTINMMAGSADNLTVTLDTALTGNLTANQGTGSESTTFNGTANTANGNLTVTTLGGTDTITIGTAMFVGGTARITAGPGLDTVSQTGTWTVGGSATLQGITTWTDGGNVDLIGGNLTVNVSKNVASTLTLTAGDLVGGNLYFSGGNVVTAGTEAISFGGAGAVGGFTYISTGNVLGAANATVTLSGTAVFGRGLTVNGGTGNGAESFSSATTNVFGGNISLFLGNGTDSAIIRGLMGGNSVYYKGGVGTSNVEYGGTGNRAQVTAILSIGNDTFTLDSKASGTSLSNLYVQFGFGAIEHFQNNYGAVFDFRANIRGAKN